MARRGGRGLRIIAGKLRGSRLDTPPGKLLRPMRDQVREALFNILGEQVVEATVLDLFAGSGSLGLEALSRGAARAVFVDREPRCLDVLQKNVDRLGVSDQARALRYDLNRGLAGLRVQGPFDLVLIHPPFELFRPAPSQPLDVTRLLQDPVRTEGLLRPAARVVFETPVECYRRPEDLPALEVRLRREYGSTALFVTCSPEPTQTADP